MFDLTDPEQLGLSSARLVRIADWMDQLVATGQLAGSSVLINRGGRCGWFHASGRLELNRPDPIAKDTIFRIYSMTKPITSVAAMMLYEQGLFQLDDPISTFLPEFASTRVYAGGAGDTLRLEAARAPITIRQLLTHTSGLAHRTQADSAVAALYQAHDIDFGLGSGTLADMTRKLAELPLLFHPGTRWNYGVSTDVLGRLVEVVSGKSLDEYFTQEIFAPLGMKDTAFSVATQDIGRLATLYTLSEGEADPARASKPASPACRPLQRRLMQVDPATGGHYSRPVSLFSGGGGLTSTVGDYLRFAMMLRNGGVLGDRRILGRKTVAFMRRNHLPGTLSDMGQPQFTSDMHSGSGLGFGLGFAVVLDPCQAQVIGSTGEYFWAGVGGTHFWIDPEEDLIVIQMAQMRPASLVPTRRTLRSLVYQALM
jgi:CubicO group peptidase (beta-lactamase class C family)